jgi:hypothetical protein
MYAVATSGIVTYGGVESGVSLLLPTDSAIRKSVTSTGRDRYHIGCMFAVELSRTCPSEGLGLSCGRTAQVHNGRGMWNGRVYEHTFILVQKKSHEPSIVGTHAYAAIPS